MTDVDPNFGAGYVASDTRSLRFGDGQHLTDAHGESEHADGLDEQLEAAQQRQQSTSDGSPDPDAGPMSYSVIGADLGALSFGAGADMVGGVQDSVSEQQAHTYGQSEHTNGLAEQLEAAQQRQQSTSDGPPDADADRMVDSLAGVDVGALSFGAGADPRGEHEDSVSEWLDRIEQQQSEQQDASDGSGGYGQAFDDVIGAGAGAINPAVSDVGGQVLAGGGADPSGGDQGLVTSPGSTDFDLFDG